MANGFIVVWLNSLNESVIHVVEDIAQIKSYSYILLNSNMSEILREERSLVDPECFS